MAMMEQETVTHEIRVVTALDDDDNSSIASFEELPRRSRVPPMPMPMPIPPMPGSLPIHPPPSKEMLKVNGKIPDVLHVLKYLGWNDRVVEYRQSTAPFKDVPEYTGDFQEDANFDPASKPVIEIVTKIFVGQRSGSRRVRNPRRKAPTTDRPITEAFEQVDYRYDDYYSDEDGNHEAMPTELARPVMLIHSAHLINALKAVISYYPNVLLDGPSISISSPYRVLYHCRSELAHYRDNQPDTHDEEYTATTASHIDALLGFLEQNLGEQIREEEARHKLKTPLATFDYFWLLLKPGSLFYAKRYDIWTPYVISSVNSHHGNRDSYRVNGWMLESNGLKVNRYMYSFTVFPWIGEQAIKSLPVIPAEFWPEDLASQEGKSMKERCTELGRLYWELLKRPTYMEYEGLLVNSGSGNRQTRGPTGFMQGRVICDAPGFDNYHTQGPDCGRGYIRRGQPVTYSQTAPPAKDHLPKNISGCGCRACANACKPKLDSPYVGFEDLDPLEDTPPENELFFYVLSNTMPGFILGERRWGHLNVTCLKPVRPDREAFKYLVLDDEIKLTVKALIGKFANDLSTGHLSPWGNDFIKNKGEGRIFLLHGAPGVGKTCTAECVAELTNRPLINLTSGDLGTDCYNIEPNLSYFLELGQRYGALVLLDEADVYLERRRSSDISRNGLVSVFLRALEYYRGVLFLTTNRVQSFDTAFLSRIHVALHYKNLRDEDRERIWAQNFDRLDRDSRSLVRVSVAAREFVWKNSEVRALRWNGREIRNAMQTALALAESDAQEDGDTHVTLSEKHLRAVVKMSRGFRDFINSSFENMDADAEVDEEDVDEEDSDGY